VSIFNEALDNINRGRAGLNEGLSIGLPRLTYYIPGVQPGNIYLIGGVTGSGKSALAMSSFVHNPYEDWKNNKRLKIKLKIFVWSLEISREILMTKFICRSIFRNYGILVDINYVLSRGKHRISDEVYKLVLEYAKYYEEFEDVVTILGPDNPTGIRNTLLQYLKENGKETHKEITVQDNGVPTKRTIFDKYTHNETNTIIIAVVDHLNILKSERSFNKKQNIDKLTEYMVEMSNKYGLSPVLVQQINRSVEHIDRQKGSTIDIMISDFKETGDTTDAAHFILAINYPWRWEVKKYRGYNTESLGDRARFISVLKNRDGNANAYLGTQFVGEIGAFRELPKAEVMTITDYQQIKALTKYYEREDSTNSGVNPPNIPSESKNQEPTQTDNLFSAKDG
jgi:hypothetical protein